MYFTLVALPYFGNEILLCSVLWWIFRFRLHLLDIFERFSLKSYDIKQQKSNLRSLKLQNYKIESIWVDADNKFHILIKCKYESGFDIKIIVFNQKTKYFTTCNSKILKSWLWGWRSDPLGPFETDADNKLSCFLCVLPQNDCLLTCYQLLSKTSS